MNNIKLYRPSNGTEFESFCAAWCEKCKHGKMHEDGYIDCDILGAALCFKITEPEYPQAWQYDDLIPVCTAFERKEPRQPAPIKVHESQLSLFS